MRFTLVALCVFVGAVSGCTSSADLADSMRPSMEVTSSIGKAAPVPPAAVAEAVADAAMATAEAAVELPVQVAALVPVEKPSFPGERHSVIPQRFKDAHPINFGPNAPQRHAVHGVDVSRWQGEIDWAKLRAQGANFVYIKATDGGDHLDPMFATNWREAAQAGLRRGAYHFFYWCRVASEQADWFIRNVPKVAGALPPVIDVEWNAYSSCRKRPSRAVVLEKMQVFMDRLERHYGQRPVIYTAPDFYADNLKGAFRDYPFWLRSVAAHPSKVYPGRDWMFWQYSGSGLSKGVDGRIDLNVFHGDSESWNRWLARHTR